MTTHYEVTKMRKIVKDYVAAHRADVAIAAFFVALLLALLVSP